MIIFPEINPHIFSVKIPIIDFTLAPTWYGLMYLLAFGSFYGLSMLRRERFGWTREEVDDYLTYVMGGVIFGGRIGYCLFPYGWEIWSRDILYPLKIWQGGMSFHGGLLGVLVGSFLFARRYKKPTFAVCDFVSMSAAIGIFFGRIGNFINAELWGKTTDLLWGIVFPNAGDLPRHPSMLYEAFLEGFVLSIVMWIYTKKDRPIGRASGLFILLYGIFRFLVEFIRVPDVQLGYYLNWLTMGQILSLPMILFGLYLLKRNAKLS